jgi:hypothetical protein
VCPGCIRNRGLNRRGRHLDGRHRRASRELRGKNKKRDMEMPKVVSRETWLRARKAAQWDEAADRLKAFVEDH